MMPTKTMSNGPIPSPPWKAKSALSCIQSQKNVEVAQGQPPPRPGGFLIDAVNLLSIDGIVLERLR